MRRTLRYVRRACLYVNTLWSATFVGSELHSFVLRAMIKRFSYWYRGESSRERKFHVTFQGAKVPRNESSWERKFQGTKVPGNDSSMERKCQGAKVPGSESSTYGTFALGSESTLGWSMAVWKILKFFKTHLHKFKYVLSDVLKI